MFFASVCWSLFDHEQKIFNYCVLAILLFSTKSQYVKTGNSSFEMVEQFRYVGTTLTNQNSIQEDSKEQTEVKERLLSFGAASLSSSLLSKTIKIKIYRTVVLPFVFLRV
jgi:hypothetical protein